MIETIDLTPLIGTEVRMPRADLLSGDHADELRELLEQRGVLVFKQLGLTDAEQLQLTKSLGTPESQGGKDVMEVALDPKYHKGQEFLAEYLKGSFFWHIDGASSDRPNLASLLTARTLSSEGGQTQFANTYAAFEALPEAEQRELEQLRVVHSTETSQRYIKPEPSLAELQGWRRIGRKTTRWSGPTARAASPWCSAPPPLTLRAWTISPATNCSPACATGRPSRNSSSGTTGTGATC